MTATCGKFLLCRYTGACDCNACGCVAVSDSGKASFDMQFGTADASGSSDFGNVRLFRQ